MPKQAQNERISRGCQEYNLVAYVRSQIKSLRAFIGKSWMKISIFNKVKGLQCNLLFFEHNAPFFDYRGGGSSQKSLTQQSPDSTFAFPESENNQCP